jgi:hypothetical protein
MNENKLGGNQSKNQGFSNTFGIVCYYWDWVLAFIFLPSKNCNILILLAILSNIYVNISAVGG